MTRDVKVIVSGTGIHLCFENADCEFSDRLTVGQTRRLMAELEKAVSMVDPEGRTKPRNIKGNCGGCALQSKDRADHLPQCSFLEADRDG